MVILQIEIIEAMEELGGGFVKALAQAYRKADTHNQAKLRGAFPEYWKQYEELAGLKKQRDQKKGEQNG